MKWILFRLPRLFSRNCRILYRDRLLSNGSNVLQSKDKKVLQYLITFVLPSFISRSGIRLQLRSVFINTAFFFLDAPDYTYNPDHSLSIYLEISPFTPCLALCTHLSYPRTTQPRIACLCRFFLPRSPSKSRRCTGLRSTDANLRYSMWGVSFDHRSIFQSYHCRWRVRANGLLNYVVGRLEGGHVAYTTCSVLFDFYLHLWVSSFSCRTVFSWEIYSPIDGPDSFLMFVRDSLDFISITNTTIHCSFSVAVQLVLRSHRLVWSLSTSDIRLRSRADPFFFIDTMRTVFFTSVCYSLNFISIRSNISSKLRDWTPS